MSMIRVLYDHEFFSVFGYSGISRYFHELARRVAVGDGFRASVFMGFHVNRFGLMEDERGRFERFFSRPRPRIPKTARLFEALNDALFPWFGRACRADLLHQTYYKPLYPGFRGKRAVTVYDMTYELMPEMFPPAAPQLRQKAAAVERADGVVAISESTKRDLVRLLGTPEEKVRVIHLGNSLTADPGPARKVEAPYLLYVGQRVPHKNFGTLLEALGSSPGLKSEFRLVCFGGGPFTPAEREAIRARGLEGRLDQMSGPDTLLANLYRHARALVYPSLYEGFGLPVLEAMGYGCPVALSNTSSLPEVAGDAGTYFDPKDPGGMARQVERLAFDDAARADASERSVRRAAGFTWEACAEKTMAYYADLLGR